MHYAHGNNVCTWLHDLQKAAHILNKQREYQGQNQIFHVAGGKLYPKAKTKVSLLQSRKVDFQKDKKINQRGKNWRKTTALGKYFDELSAGSKYFDKLLMVSCMENFHNWKTISEKTKFSVN